MNEQVNIGIIYEDKDMVVCEKPVGLLTLRAESDEDSLIDILCKQLSQRGERATLFPIHRLDRLTGGLVVFAKTKKCAEELCRIFSEHKNEKQYLCIVHGAPEKEYEECIDLLFADKRANKSYITDKKRAGVKEASLCYEKISEGEHRQKSVSLLRVTLNTGRMHQIRAQLSHRGMPLLGDGKYGSRENSCPPALFAYRLKFFYQGEKRFTLTPKNEFPWSLFYDDISRICNECGEENK